MLRGGGGSGSGGSGALTPTQIANFNNSTALLMPKFRAAIGNTKAGGGNTRIVTVGDSITAGAYSNGSGSGDWRNNSWPTQLARMFASSGVPAVANSFMGFSIANNDGRITFGSSWAIGLTTAGNTTVGGPFLTGTNATNAANFTPTAAVDTFKVWYPTLATAGTMSYAINGGSTTNIVETGASGFTSTTINPTLGINTISFKYVTGNFVDIAGVEAWNSQIPCVNIVNAGWNGATTTNYADATQAWSPGNHISSLAPDLTIIALGLNDFLISNSIPVATTKANIQILITNALTTGDVVLLCENPAEVATTVPLATQAQYWQAVKDLATSNNIGLVSIFDRWVSYEFSSVAPISYYMGGGFPANLHPVGKGYSDQAQAIFNLIGNP